MTWAAQRTLAGGAEQDRFGARTRVFHPPPGTAAKLDDPERDGFSPNPCPQEWSFRGSVTLQRVSESHPFHIPFIMRIHGEHLP